MRFRPIRRARQTCSTGASWLCLAALLAAAPAAAQTASRVTPERFTPAARNQGSGLVLSGAPGLAAPAGADRLSVTLGTVEVEAAPAGFEAEVAALTSRLAGRRIAASEVFAAARELEAAFVNAGALLTRVILPPQTLRDGGRLRLVVVRGFVERIDLANIPERARARVSAVLAPLEGRRDLEAGEIERLLLLAGDTPGVGLRSTLVAGDAPGATRLVIDGTYRPVTGFVGGDNTVGRALGGFTFGTGFDVNTALGFGETLYVRALGHPDRDDALRTGSPFGAYPRLRTLAGGLLVPLGTDGLTFNVEYTNSQTAPKLSNLIQTNSDYDRLSFRLRYPWLRSRAANFTSEVTFDATQETLGLNLPGLSVPLSLDRLRIARLAGEGDLRLPTGGLFAGRATLSLGLDGLGARTAAEATPILPLSRLGSDASFQKFEIAASFTQPLPQDFVLGLYARGQTSFGQPLPRSEQIGTASFQELSTFDAGSLSGDSGFVFRSELSRPFSFVASEGRPATVTPYVFGATGTLYLERPTILETKSLQVSSVGVGVRLATLLVPGTTTEAAITVEFGRRFRSDALPDANRVTVLGSIRF